MRSNLTSPTSATKNETMAPLHVATLTVKRELPKVNMRSNLTSPTSATKNETMAPLHVATLRELPKILKRRGDAVYRCVHYIYRGSFHLSSPTGGWA